MNTLEIAEKESSFNIPSHWDEMSPEQIKECISAWQEAVAKGDMLSAQIRCFYKIAGIRRSWKSIFLEKIMPSAWRMEKNANIAMLSAELTAFMFRFTENASEINYDTITNHFPVIRTKRGLDLYGPSDLLADLTFGEFRAAIEELDEYYDLIKQNGPPVRGTSSEIVTDEQLSRFIACLYRPLRKKYKQVSRSETFDGFKREPFNRMLIEPNRMKVDSMHPVHRTIILLWFTYCVSYIQTGELVISGREISLRRLFPRAMDKTGKKRALGAKDRSGWVSILYAISKEGVFGDAGQTEKVGLFDILLYMYDRDLENQRLKRNMKSHSKT